MIIAESPAKHALTHHGRVGLGIIKSVNRVVQVAGTSQFRAALGDSLQAGPEVYDSNGGGLIHRDRPNLDNMWPAGKTFDLCLSIECVVDFHWAKSAYIYGPAGVWRWPYIP